MLNERIKNKDIVRRSQISKQQLHIQENKPAAQTLPNATPPNGKINPFSKMAVTFAPMMGF